MTPRKARFRQEDIEETAFQMVRKSGWSGLSVPAVAKAIKSSTMPIYSHYKNVRELEDAVYLKALDFLLTYMTAERTGDRWLDHAIGYVRFATEEAQLFRSLFDGRNPELQNSSLERWEKLLRDQLTDHPLFEGLSDDQIHSIRHARFMLVHGFASGINNGWHRKLDEQELVSFLRIKTKALYDGLMLHFESEKET